jgi:transcriptional regulator
MRRELETGLRSLLPGHAGGNPRYSQGAAYELPRPFPTLPGNLLSPYERSSMGKTKYLQGALDLLILKTLALGPNHGWGIQQRIRQVSREALAVSQGSLYPALHRLEAAGIVASEMTLSDNNRRARVYRCPSPKPFRPCRRLIYGRMHRHSHADGGCGRTTADSGLGPRRQHGSANSVIVP